MKLPWFRKREQIKPKSEPTESIPSYPHWVKFVIYKAADGSPMTNRKLVEDYGAKDLFKKILTVGEMPGKIEDAYEELDKFAAGGKRLNVSSSFEVHHGIRPSFDTEHSEETGERMPSILVYNNYIRDQRDMDNSPVPRKKQGELIELIRAHLKGYGLKEGEHYSEKS